jgi:hypothetical protein
MSTCSTVRAASRSAVMRAPRARRRRDTR